ncbi:MAG TPA: asparagine synthase (glutamine-hydrolyzing) [Chitinophagaceae bacterium]|nr:asparagine synthase (glutamine-hydrolyzing) [Chitinophagaceae bacterium]
MCGIAGIISSHSQKRSEEICLLLKQKLHLMTASLQHRGPDGECVWVNPDGNAGLGHRRLSIIDLSTSAAQPMNYLDRYQIVHNGEIYNYIELKKELTQIGYSFRTQSDTEVILAAYDHWDDECVERFDGMFAFAIWDEKEQELFAARDRFGEKPFFYHFNEEQFAFASEMKAFWTTGIQRKVNLRMLFNFITIGYVDNPEQSDETFYETIFKLPPASRLYYTPADHQLFIERYWDIDTSICDKKITDTEATEQFKHLLTNSVQKRLRSDVAIGTSLSGGLDSSSIISLISQQQSLNYKPQTFTAVFTGFEKDEGAISKKVADQFGLQQHIVNLGPEQMVNDWESFLYHQEEPVGSASAFAQYKVFELAKQHNTTVLLDGQGADEILAGYHKYYKWYWQELFQKRKLLRSGEIVAARKIGVQEKFNFKNIMASLLPDLASVILERQYLFHALNHEDLTKEFVRLQSKEAYYTTPELSHLNGVLYFNTCVHGLEELLRYADRNAMAHGREVRLPFLNHQLVEFIFSLPSHFKIREGWTKWLLRQSMNQQLPTDIVWRKDKVGFEPPQKQWMQNKKLREMVQDARQKLVKEKILKPEINTKPIQASSAYDADTDDWKYLTAAYFI